MVVLQANQLEGLAVHCGMSHCGNVAPESTRLSRTVLPELLLAISRTRIPVGTVSKQLSWHVKLSERLGLMGQAWELFAG